MQRKTRIVATLGPAADRPGILERLLEAGLDVARISFSHGTADEHKARIARLRELAGNMGRPVAVLADLPGPKLRVLLDEPIELEAGNTYTLGLKPSEEWSFNVTEPEALVKVRTGQRVLLDDGRLQARVANVSSDRLLLEVEVGGSLLPNKGMNLPDSELAIPAVTRRDREAIGAAMEAGADWFALSFVRDAAAAHELRGVIRGYGREVPILAKIERPEAVRRAQEIIEAFDAIMVARGDLGVEIALEKVPHVQKRLINMARLAGKPVVTATDMLDSMRRNPRPTRAEASDVANAVYDGTDAVMLSGETAIGEYPVQALQCMHRILMEAEAHQHDDSPTGLTIPKGELSDHVTHLTCNLARETHARAIIAPTLTGRTARMVARHRPEPSIVAVSADEQVLRRLSLVWGVRAVPTVGPIRKGDDRLQAAVHAAFVGKAVQKGDLVVVIAGHPVEGGEGFPTIRLVCIGANGESCEP